MTPPENAAIDAARAAAAHLREEAEHNRSWIRRPHMGISPAFIAWRLEVAAERARWADVIEALARASGLRHNGDTAALGDGEKSEADEGAGSRSLSVPKAGALPG